MNSFEDVAASIDSARHALICGHIMPDGDSLGSALALGLIMEGLGKKATVAGPDPAPAIYSFLPGFERIHIGAPPKEDFDTIITLDCSMPERLGSGYKELLSSDLFIINIDHHTGSVPFGTCNYFDPEAAAVGQILFDLFSLMQVVISREVAACLYTAITTDTGSFQYNNTTPGTHRRVAELLGLGVSAAQVNIHLNEEKPRAALLLLGAALNALSVSSCGKVCWTTITRETLRSTGAKDEYTDGLVNYTRSIRGVEVGLLFRELSEGNYKISFRSKGFVDVNRLAALFGGGGHPCAAGCIVRGDLKEVQDKVIAAAVIAAAGGSSR